MKFSAATFVLATLMAIASAQSPTLPTLTLPTGSPSPSPSVSPSTSGSASTTASTTVITTTTVLSSTTAVVTVTPTNTPSSGDALNVPFKLLVAVGAGAVAFAQLL